MGFRETYGGMVEAILNEQVDKHMNADAIKKQLHDLIDKLVDEKLENLKDAVKEAIDKIDGEVDLK